MERRFWRLIATATAIGGAFSLLATVSFARPWPDPAAFLASATLGALEGLIIGGAGLACATWLPSITSRRRWRIPLVFGLGTVLHASLSLVTGTGLWMAPLVGLLASLVGEALDATLELQRMRTEIRPGEVPALSPRLVQQWGLTDREVDVAVLLLERMTYVEIGARLFISLATVKTHSSRVYAKSGARGRSGFHELVANHPERLTTNPTERGKLNE